MARWELLANYNNGRGDWDLLGVEESKAEAEQLRRYYIENEGRYMSEARYTLRRERPARTGHAVFHRTWWRRNPDWPDGREPHAGRRTYIARGVTEEQARALCKAWNETHEPGPLSRKAEYESEGRA